MFPFIDILILLVFAISIWVGIARGFTREIIPLTSLALGIWLAIKFGFSLGEIYASWLPSDFLESGISLSVLDFNLSKDDIAGIIGFISIIFGIQILGTLVYRGVKSIFSHMPIHYIDKLFGGIFGILRAWLFVWLFVIIAALTKLATYDWWRNSFLIPHFIHFALEALPFLPPEFHEFLFPALSNMHHFFDI